MSAQFTAFHLGHKQVITEAHTKCIILGACHDDCVGGCHFGQDKTVAKVSARFYWKGIHKDVANWVSVHD